MPETYYCYNCRRSVSATQQADGSYMCNECHQNFVEIRDEPETQPTADTSQINNGRRNPLFGQSSVVRLPNGMVTMYFSTAGNQFNPDGIDQLFNLLLQGISRHNEPPHTSHRFIQSLVHRHPTEEELSTSPVCAVCENDIVKEDEIVCLPCNHLFHPDCILPWIENHNTCPTCRAELPASQSDSEDGV